MLKNIAAIDIGTNSFHLIVAKILDDASFEIVDREKEVIRLSEGTVGDIKLISSDAMERGIRALNNMKGIAQSHNAEICAAATSALRESLNKDEFIEKVYSQTGIKINLVSGDEEARLIYLGILRALPVFDKQILCVDIGGGSAEFTIGLKGKIIYSKSLKLGAVRLSQMFFPDFQLDEAKIEECRNWIHGTLYPITREIKRINFDLAIGSSGTIMSTGIMISADNKIPVPPNKILNNFSFSAKELSKISDKVLSAKTPEKRIKLRGIDEKRADIFPAGLLILNEIFSLLKLKNMTISGYALREGIIADQITRSLGNKLSSGYNVRRESVEQMCNKFKFDAAHCNHVAELSGKLFDLTKPLHNLGGDAKEYLIAAAKLHDIGYHLSHDQHHKHSLYIIKNHGLLGYSNGEIKIIANVARYHRKSHPKKSHSDYSSMLPAAQEIVKVLSSILRISDSLDRLHSGTVTNIDFRLESGKGLLFVYYEKHFPEIEMWNLERRKSLFEEVFNIEIIPIAKKI